MLRAPLAAYSSSSTADQDQSKEKQVEKEAHAPAPTKGAHDSETFEEFTDRSGENSPLIPQMRDFPHQRFSYRL